VVGARRRSWTLRKVGIRPCSRSVPSTSFTWSGRSFAFCTRLMRAWDTFIFSVPTLTNE
jgi:hypothetical protein